MHRIISLSFHACMLVCVCSLLNVYKGIKRSQKSAIVRAELSYRNERNDLRWLERLGLGLDGQWSDWQMLIPAGHIRSEDGKTEVLRKIESALHLEKFGYFSVLPADLIEGWTLSDPLPFFCHSNYTSSVKGPSLDNIVFFSEGVLS